MFEDDLIVNLNSHLEGRVSQKIISREPFLSSHIMVGDRICTISHPLPQRISITLEINAEAPAYRLHHLMWFLPTLPPPSF